MRRKFKIANFGITTIMIVFVTAISPLMTTSNVSAACTDDPGNQLACFCEDPEVAQTLICKTNEEDLNKTEGGILEANGIVKKVINTITLLTGILAGIFIIYGGVQIITSRGESDKIKNARNRIIYACIGLAVLLLSNLIIGFVLNLVNKTNS